MVLYTPVQKTFLNADFLIEKTHSEKKMGFLTSISIQWEIRGPAGR